MQRWFRYVAASVMGLGGVSFAMKLVFEHRETWNDHGELVADAWVLRDLAYVHWYEWAILLGGVGSFLALAIVLARRSRAAWIAGAPLFAALGIGYAGHAVTYGKSPFPALIGIVVGLYVVFFVDGWGQRHFFRGRADATPERGA